MQDLIERDPTQAHSQIDLASGQVIRRTGDAVTDKWEEQVSRGETPDFLAAFAKDDKLVAYLNKQKQAPVVEEFHDKYEPKK